MQEIQATIEEIIYHNQDNGYTVISVISDEGQITCVGIMYSVEIGQSIEARGRYTDHPVYGRQFKVEEFIVKIAQDKDAIFRYLASGAIKGIGPTLAARITEKFESESLEIMENYPERLAEVKGISIRKAQEIAGELSEQNNMRQIIIFLRSYNISMGQALKIYNEFKEASYDVVKNRPYMLFDRVKGIGFKIADMIAMKAGIDKADPSRIMAAITFVLTKATEEGHTYLPKSSLLKRAESLLNINLKQFDNILIEMQLKTKIVMTIKDDIEIVQLEYYYRMENYIAFRLNDLSKTRVKECKIDQAILLGEDLGYDSLQIKAIDAAMTRPILVITGGPGTGKTTIINTILKLFEKNGLEIAMAAPTGRAAKRMSETTGYEAKTVHRLLEYNYNQDDKTLSFARDESYPLEADVIIIDEASMLDIPLTYHLLKAIPEGMRLLLIGDKDQLPPVGPGNMLKDIIDSKINIEKIELKKIYRQGKGSGISINAHRVNNGQALKLENYKDFFFINRKKNEHILKEIVSLMGGRLSKFTGLSSKNDMQVLTPMKKGYLGSIALNNELQKVLNPYSSKKNEKKIGEKVLREGDKIMQIKNNYQLEWEILSEHGFALEEGRGVFNGDIGIVDEINFFTETIRVIYDDKRIVNYPFNRADELELAYAVTVHKSQGSEYPIVIMPIFKGPYMLLTRNLLYTAISRGKIMVVLVGQKNLAIEMINNNRDIVRYSSLKSLLDQW